MMFLIPQSKTCRIEHLYTNGLYFRELSSTLSNILFRQLKFIFSEKNRDLKAFGPERYSFFSTGSRCASRAPPVSAHLGTVRVQTVKPSVYRKGELTNY